MLVAYQSERNRPKCLMLIRKGNFLEPATDLASVEKCRLCTSIIRLVQPKIWTAEHKEPGTVSSERCQDCEFCQQSRGYETLRTLGLRFAGRGMAGLGVVAGLTCG